MHNVPDVLKIAYNAYKLVLENESVRVMELKLRPGEKAPMHNHPNGHVVYIMNDAKFKLDFSDGKSGRPPTLATAHVGDTVGFNLVVELKK